MPKIDSYEREVLSAYEQGQLKSVASKAELARFKAAARATTLKERRANIRSNPLAPDIAPVQKVASSIGRI